MTIEGAVITEQGVTFAIVIVKPSVLTNHAERDRIQAAFSRELFDGLPVVLMSQDARGVPSYYGRRDLSEFMANVPLDAVPWRRYTVRDR